MTTSDAYPPRYVVLAAHLDHKGWFIHLETDSIEEARATMGQAGLRLIDTENPVSSTLTGDEDWESLEVTPDTCRHPGWALWDDNRDGKVKCATCGAVRGVWDPR